MARVAIALSCTAEQRAELMALARSRTEEARLVERAKIMLACLEGKRKRRGWTRAWGAPEYGWSVAQALCGGGTGRVARSGAAGQDPEIWRRSAPAGSAPTGIAAPQGIGQLGRRVGGGGPGRLGRCDMALVAQGRGATAPTALVVRQPRPTICSQSRRYHRALPEPAG